MVQKRLNKSSLTNAIQDWMIKNRVRECPVYIKDGNKITTFIIFRDMGDRLYAQKPGHVPCHFEDLHRDVIKLIHKEFIIEN